MAVERKSGSPIVTIEDDPQVQLLIEKILQNLGHHRVVFMNSPDALFEYLTRTPRPQLIILDLFLGPKEKYGLSTLIQLKTHPSYNAIPVIVLTIDERPELKEACLKAGAVAVIPKLPFDITYIETVIRENTP